MPQDTDGDGICDAYEIPGCTDSNACNYASGATDDDGSCDLTSCQGCTSPFACNYDTSASIDDGSCDFTSCIVFGCADSSACNYDPLADYDDGSCTYPTPPYDCDGSCLKTPTDDGICDEYESSGMYGQLTHVTMLQVRLTMMDLVTSHLVKDVLHLSLVTMTPCFY